MDLNSNYVQKRQKCDSNDSNLDNKTIESVISGLTLINKLKLELINRQFKACVERVLGSEESLRFVNSYGIECDVFVDYNRNTIDLNQIGFEFKDSNHCLVRLLAKFAHLRRLEFDNNIRINNQMIEWLFTRCPQLDSLSLLDYRCNYQTIDWHKMGDTLANRLVSLQIECRLNQQISGKHLSQLVSKLNGLKELSIVCPQRRLQEVFAKLGPNVVKLKITYCLSLDLDEIQTLIDGNGRHLEELVIHFKTEGRIVDQNREFALICAHLTALKSFTFNHYSLSYKALALIANLKNLQKFNYNFIGICLRNRFTSYLNSSKSFDFKHFGEPSALLSLTLTNVELSPQNMFVWPKWLTNLKHLNLNTTFRCDCSTIQTNNCPICIKKCFYCLSNLKNLRSINFSNSSIVYYSQCLQLLQQISSLELNMYRIIDKNMFLNILLILEQMATNVTKLSVRLYGLKSREILRLKKLNELHKNLRITLDYE